MRSLCLILSSSVLFASSAAMADPIEDRQALMKRNGETMKVLGPMAKGEAPYDQAAALEAFTTQNEVANKIGDLFPEDSKEGHDTAASPKIWEDMEGFLARVEKFKADTAEAVAANPADMESFGPIFTKVSGNCGGCHEVYRIKKEN